MATVSGQNTIHVSTLYIHVHVHAHITCTQLGSYSAMQPGVKRKLKKSRQSDRQDTELQVWSDQS